MDKIELKQMFQTCDLEIKSGAIQSAQRRLNSVVQTRVPRESRLEMANLCRRAGLYSLGLTLLHRFIHPPSRHQNVVATPAEIAEYSVLLMRMGVVSEALKRLNSVEPSDVPEVLLFRAFGHFYQWEFPQAIATLESYVRSPISPYAKLVGQANLAHALIESGREDEARTLLDENIQMARASGNHNIQSQLHVCRAQIFLRDSNFKKANAEIAAARSIVENSSKSGWIEKWQLISEALETRKLEPLNHLRNVSRALCDWGAMREADLFSLKIAFDQVRFIHLVFGTPLPAYRERICKEIGHLPNRTTYVMGQKSAPRFDLQSGEIDGKPSLKPGQKCHKLLDILLKDFYEPRRVGSLFVDLFPGEYFNIGTSPDRVHQILWRTRKWIDENQIPIQIGEANGFYELSITGQLSFRIPLERSAIDTRNVQFEKLKSLLHDKNSFTQADVQAKLRLSRVSVWKLMKWADENRKTVQSRQSGTIVYRMAG